MFSFIAKILPCMGYHDFFSNLPISCHKRSILCTAAGRSVSISALAFFKAVRSSSIAFLFSSDALAAAFENSSSIRSSSALAVPTFFASFYLSIYYLLQRLLLSDSGYQGLPMLPCPNSQLMALQVDLLLLPLLPFSFRS